MTLQKPILFIIILGWLSIPNLLSAQSPPVVMWDKTFGGNNSDVPFSLQQTIDGGYILGGNSKSLISGDKTQNNWGDFDYWIIKTDSIGNKLWDKTFGGYGLDFLRS